MNITAFSMRSPIGSKNTERPSACEMNWRTVRPNRSRLSPAIWGLSPGELLSVTAKGPHAANELPKLLRALGVDPQKLSSEHPGTMRDLQRICVTCGHKGQCQHDLARGTAAGHYRDY